MGFANRVALVVALFWVAVCSVVLYFAMKPLGD